MLDAWEHTYARHRWGSSIGVDASSEDLDTSWYTSSRMEPHASDHSLYQGSSSHHFIAVCMSERNFKNAAIADSPSKIMLNRNIGNPELGAALENESYALINATAADTTAVKSP